MGAPVALAERLYRIDAPLGERFASLYLVVGDTSTLLFDTGIDGMIPEFVVPQLASIGLTVDDISHVVVSHCDVDHFGGVADAHESFPNARVLAHPLERAPIENFDTFLSERGRGFLDEWGFDEDQGTLDWLREVTRERPLDGTVIDGEVIDLGGARPVVWHVPGHSRGHLAIELPWASAVLVSDAVLGSSVNLADGTPAFPPTYRYVDDYLATVARLSAAHHDLLLTAHYPAMSGATAAEFLAESAAFAQRLDALVVAALGAADDLTLAELVHEINDAAGDWPTDGTEAALAFPVVGHLERLRDAGRLQPAGNRDGVPTWRLS